MILFITVRCDKHSQEVNSSGLKHPLPAEITNYLADTTTVNKLVDSLKYQLKICKLDTSSIVLMAKISSAIGPSSISLVLAKEAFERSKSQNYSYGEAYSTLSLGIFYEKYKNFEKADSILNLCAQNAEKNNFGDLNYLAVYHLGKVRTIQNKYAESLTYYERSLKIAENLNDSAKMAISNRDLGRVYYYLADHTRSLHYLFRSIEYNAGKAKDGDANALGFIGQVYYMMDDYSSALKYYLQQLKIMMEIEDQIGISRTYGFIGELYRSINDYRKATDYYEWSLKRAIELKDLDGVAFTYNCLGEVYFVQNEFKQALNCFEKSIPIAQRISDPDSYGYAMNMAGACYAQFGDLKKALDYHSKAVAEFRSIDDVVQVANGLMNLGSDHSRLRNYALAKIYIDSAIVISKQNYSHDNLKDCYLVLSNILEQTGNAKEALMAFKLHTAYRDSLLNSEKINSFSNVELKDREDQLKSEQNRKDAVHKAEQASQDEKLKREKLIKYCFGIGAFLLLLLAVVIFKNLKESRSAKKIIEDQKAEVEEQKKLIEEKNKEVLDSINYAKRIQYALLAHKAFLNEHLQEHFVLFKPKDIVSGDFYWASKVNNRFYLAVCDSTGHGVPGAFMSLLNIGFLSEAINEKHIKEPSKVFDFVRERLIGSLSQDERKDGMDGTLICWEKDTRKITYASANNSPVLVSSNKAIILQKSKMPVGKGELVQNFDLFELSYTEGDMLYLFTDGYADQFGGPKGKKFKYKQLELLLAELAKECVKKQEELLEAKLNEWKGSIEQVDDVCIIGVRL